jgi:regulation of enolase protein 1 (concanavalin A-like superfamily)
VDVTNGGVADVLDWTQSDDASWLMVTPGGGTTPDTLTVSVDPSGLSDGSYSGIITVEAPGATNSPQTLEVTLTVNPEGTEHYDFSYPDRASLLGEGWDFLAVTPSGGTRDTEQLTGAVVSYDQVVHPGVTRIPCDTGDLWGALNSTRNSLFRDLPSEWTSVRLKLAAFAPTQNYQQAGLVVYQDDDNYVQVTRIYGNGNNVTFVREVNQSARVINSIAEATTTNLYLRLDRDPLTEEITGYYSLDGDSWTTLVSVTLSLTNPRLGIVVGASPSGFPNVDVEWAEILM